MPYIKQARQIHNTIIKAGNYSTLQLICPQKAHPITGISVGEDTIETIYYVQTHYTAQDLADDGIASGLTKLLMSPLDSKGDQIENFVSMLQNKKAYVLLQNGNTRISVKLAKLVMPDSQTPILARVFVGG